VSGRDHATPCTRCWSYSGGLNDLVCCDDLSYEEIAIGLREEVGRLREESDHFRLLHNDAERRRGDARLELNVVRRRAARWKALAKREWSPRHINIAWLERIARADEILEREARPPKKRDPLACPVCGEPPAYSGAVYCGAACAAKKEGA
jgi:hypothetical protein